jgi:hypothetical protein
MGEDGASSGKVMGPDKPVEEIAKSDGARNSEKLVPNVSDAKAEARRRQLAGLVPYKPGQVGNPGGRRPIPPEIIKVLQLGSKGAAERLVELTRHKDGRIALTAIDMLQNRLYGRPTQQVDAQVTTTNVQQAHLQILIELQQRREQALKTIEGEVESEQDTEQKD